MMATRSTASWACACPARVRARSTRPSDRVPCSRKSRSASVISTCASVSLSPACRASCSASSAAARASGRPDLLSQVPSQLSAWARATPGAPPGTDRKSTRLNSSHLGISYAVFCLKKKKKHGVIAASAGNHAQGVAYHAGRHKVRARILMPLPTPLTKVSATRAYGAEVVLHGANYDEAYGEAVEQSRQDCLTLIHAFDD